MKYKLIKTLRKTLALQIKNGELIVRSPKIMPKFMIDNFVAKNKAWIEKKMKAMYPEWKPVKKNESEIVELKKKAKSYIPNRVKYFAEKFGKKYNKIKITSARTRWWSCTSQKNLNFSYRLIQADNKAIDYVIIHELAHLKYMNHSKAFWNHVEEMMPDYKEWHNWLKKEGKNFW